MSDDTDTLTLTFFSARPDYLEKLLPAGETRYVSGTAEFYDGMLQMVHPDRVVDEKGFAALPLVEPVYPLTEGLALGNVRRAVDGALAKLPDLPEWQDEAWVARERLPAFSEALRALHRPHEPHDIAPENPAWTRLAYDELLAGQLALALMRANMRRQAGHEHAGDGHLRAKVLKALPYALTHSQQKAVDDIVADLSKPERMLRLLQGDVGSGKTLVAFAASAGIVAAGGQAVWMAPTEILAQQHTATLRPWCLTAGIRLALLTGSMTRGERATVIQAAAAGTVDLVVGTHALLTEDVQFRRLGLVVVDEQHRFGVRQRATLRDKGRAPHLLVLTATPIPRTLALSLVGELDVSTLREAPPGRRPPDTTLMAGPVARARFRLAEHVRRDMLQGFVVCPQIEAGAREASDVDEAAAELRTLLPGKRIEVIHGRVDPARRAAAMAEFRAGAIDVLVATTVIEVGVDVPEARFMLIEHAEHFGLSQLHQLRGRIGR
ncbi:MAG TPA: ATP-dependent DNA helicase RecG, partial [Ideonella sp.]|nr:ATP-dependent DNA helicase RecG [Ideonella sp.]